MEARKEMFDQMEKQLTAGRTPELAAITEVAAGYAGDMLEEQNDELLDDNNFHFHKVKCNKIERMMPHLNKLVEEEIHSMYDYANL